LEDRLAVLPYVSARIGLAKALWDLGAREEAAGHFQGILDIDLKDSERVRDLLAHALLALGRAGEAEDLLARHVEDRARWHYTRALLAFPHEGAPPVARRHLAAALRSNRAMAKKPLSSRAAEPAGLRGPREPDDAVFFREAWTDIPGALDWLSSQL